MFNLDRAKKELEAQGRTLKWVGGQLDVSPTTIGRYLSGERECPKKIAIALAAIMGLPERIFWDEAKQAS